MSPSEGDAQVQQETSARGIETFGNLNQHPQVGDNKAGFRVGVSEDKNRKCRKAMEDAHSFIYDFAGVRGQGFFAVYDGHAGKKAAEWCGLNFHQYLLDNLRKEPDTPVPQLLNATFHQADAKLSEVSAEEGTHSGCTAVTCFLRLEDESGKAAAQASGVECPPVDEVTHGKVRDNDSALEEAKQDGIETADSNPREALRQVGEDDSQGSDQASSHGIKNKIKSILTGSATSKSPSPTTTSPAHTGEKHTHADVDGPAQVVSAAKRTLYTANAGDARAVLSRNGQAVRLSHDHKASDAKEAERIDQAGGFIMNQRVNGYLAVSRSLGDSAMKQFVVGSPYTTETTLGPEDDYLIVACDGLWDVCSDQEAVDLLKESGITDAQEASKKLVDYALSRNSTDNITVLVVYLN
ncbi:PP2C family serine/threonine-protein phosphatase [Sporobolomyces koalae]|uniref:PP2C family serine/threonine-protein phosphatase n=1 Tax=Sporobolomyces koalae TaxID=500713 RepID=UPI003181A7CA